MRTLFVLLSLASVGRTQESLSGVSAPIISGRVFDADGFPVPEGRLNILASTGQVFRIRSNQRGEYHLSGLVPGKYTVAAMPPEAAYAPGALKQDGTRISRREVVTFYPSALKASDSQVLDIHAGEIRSGVDIHIKRIPVTLVDVRGRVVGSRFSCRFNETLFDGAIYDISNPEQEYLFSLGRDGTFQIEEVPAGTYAAILIGNRGGSLRLSPHRLYANQAGREWTLSAEPTARIRAHIRFEDGLSHFDGLTKKEFDDLTAVSFQRLDVVENYRTRLDQADTFFPSIDKTCPEIPTGRYGIEASVPVAGSYLRTVSIGPKTYSPDSVKIEIGKSRLVELVFAVRH